MPKSTEQQKSDQILEKVTNCPGIYLEKILPAKRDDLSNILDFDQLISDIMIQFVKIPVERIDSEIRVAIRSVAEFLCFDRGAVYQVSPGTAGMVCTHQWVPQGGRPVSVSPVFPSAPWVLDQILHGRDVILPSMEDLPLNTAADKKFFKTAGTQSHVSLAMEIDGKMLGAMTLECVHREKNWSDEVIRRLKLVADVFAGALERKRRRQEEIETSRFEALLTDLSARFVKLGPGEIDQEIERSLELVGKFFKGDRCGILDVQSDRKICRLTHAWFADGVERVSKDINLATHFPWSYKKHVENGQEVIFSKLTDLPPEAGKDRQSWASMGVRSALAFPLFMGNEVCHIFSIQNLHKERNWDEQYLSRLVLLGEILINTLERRKANERLQEQEKRLRLATDCANLGLWILDTDTNEVWSTEKNRELFHIAAGVESNLENLLNSIHPGDRSRVAEAIRSAITGGEELNIEYRIVPPDGTIRWITSHGRPHFKTSGAAHRLIGVSFDTTDRKRSEEELEKQMSFEKLMVDLSARFVKITAAMIDQEIKQSLQKVVELFQGDYGGMIEMLDDRKIARVTHSWHAENIKPLPEGVNLAPLFPWLYQHISEQRKNFMFASLAELPHAAAKDRKSWQMLGTKSALIIPVFLDHNLHYLIAIRTVHEVFTWQEQFVPRLRLLGEIFVNAFLRKEAEERMRKSCEEVQALKEKLQIEAEYLRSEVNSSQTHEKIIGQSEALERVLTLVEQVAPTESTVLICGETGTGKELIARAVHSLSQHSDKVMVKVNCASLPASLVESELFGREKGAYTGALSRQIGRFELADGSSIFLDEIAELPLDLQAKLLRILQEGQFERLGSPRTIQVRVRVISATNRNLEEEVKKGNFRQDLYYRLNVFPIVVPPLRERLNDIPMLVWTFVNEFGEKMGKKITMISKRDMESLLRYDWPGNIRELRNVIEHAVIMSNSSTLQLRLPANARKDVSGSMTLQEVEVKHINEVLRHTGGRIKGDGGAAQILGMNPSTLYSRIQKLGIIVSNNKGDISS
ncbi:MAG: transcriptional regulator, Fis family [Geobacteraceae bacterium]|nr:transcriptional regulator, Fis family [Geobacteraceae bacterium]